VSSIFLETEEYTGEALDKREEFLLARQLFTYIYPIDLPGLAMMSDYNQFNVETFRSQLSACKPDSFHAKLFADNYQNVRAALQVAKAELGGAPFKGLFAGDSEIGMQVIRPGHILRSTSSTETPVNDWTVTLAAASDYWIGYDTNNTTAINIDKRLCVLPLAVSFTQGGNPQVEELYVQLGGTSYPVQVIRQSFFADNVNRIRAARIRPMIWKPKSRPLVQVYSIAASTQEMVLDGISFGLGDLLRTQIPASVQT
jgi:hypothetical protein